MFFSAVELPFQMVLLAMETHSVVDLRLRKLAAGGPAAMNEACEMATEKVVALVEATGTILAGGSADIVRLSEQMSAV